jgi:hypothetical protein
MSDEMLARIRNRYVDAFNRGALDELERLLHPRVSYLWVAAGHAEEGIVKVMALYRMGHEALGGKSRLTAVAGTDDQAIWWEPTAAGLVPRGLQLLCVEEGFILQIADEHDAVKVAEASAGLTPPV